MIILLVKSIGCFRNKRPRATSPQAVRRRALPSVEGNETIITRDFYQQRRNAIRKCALIAARHGYKVFGIRRQGLCATGPRAHVTYNRYGPSRLCQNGKGSYKSGANDVYSVSGEFL